VVIFCNKLNGTTTESTEALRYTEKRLKLIIHVLYFVSLTLSMKKNRNNVSQPDEVCSVVIFCNKLKGTTKDDTEALRATQRKYQW